MESIPYPLNLDWPCDLLWQNALYRMTCHPWVWGFLGTLLCPCKQAQASLQAGERCVVQAPPCPSWHPVNSQAWEWGHPRIASLGPSYHPQWASPAEISPDWPRSPESSWTIDSWAVEEAYWFKPLDFAVVKKNGTNDPQGLSWSTTSFIFLTSTSTTFWKSYSPCPQPQWSPGFPWMIITLLQP